MSGQLFDDCHPAETSSEKRQLGRRSKLTVLSVALLVLFVGYLAARLPGLPQIKGPFWLTDARFYQEFVGRSLDLPKDEGDDSSKERKSVKITRDAIESLKIGERQNGPESEGAEVLFVIKTDQGRYGCSGFVSLHSIDGVYAPIVNLGRGWSIVKM